DRGASRTIQCCVGILHAHDQCLVVTLGGRATAGHSGVHCWRGAGIPRLVVRLGGRRDRRGGGLSSTGAGVTMRPFITVLLILACGESSTGPTEPAEPTGKLLVFDQIASVYVV